ncbi:MAG TPA: hypothetical protein VH723_10880 [Candidatus Limnocylindrales bacterium]|jgi:hypothetical protein
MTTMTIRGASLHVDVAGHGDPLLLMHGGPRLDHIERAVPAREAAA